MKKIVAVVAIAGTAVAGTACEPSKQTKSQDKAAVVACDTSNLASARFSKKKAGTSYFTCGGAECVYTYRLNGLAGHKRGTAKYPRWVKLPANMVSGSFDSDNCNGWYKKKLKRT